MRQTALKTDVGTLSQIAALERDIALLKSSVLRKITPSGKRIVRLKGVIKGVEVSEADIASARKSLYGSVKI